MKRTTDLDSVHRLHWGITWAPAAQKEGILRVLFGGVIQDGGHCWHVCPRSQPFLKSIQAAECSLIVCGILTYFYTVL